MSGDLIPQEAGQQPAPSWQWQTPFDDLIPSGSRLTWSSLWQGHTPFDDLIPQQQGDAAGPAQVDASTDDGSLTSSDGTSDDSNDPGNDDVSGSAPSEDNQTIPGMPAPGHDTGNILKSLAQAIASGNGDGSGEDSVPYNAWSSKMPGAADVQISPWTEQSDDGGLAAPAIYTQDTQSGREGENQLIQNVNGIGAPGMAEVVPGAGPLPFIYYKTPQMEQADRQLAKSIWNGLKSAAGAIRGIVFSKRLPPGSLPIDKTPWSGDHTTIKDPLGVEPGGKVWVSPDGDVWTQNPDESYENHGPASAFTGSGKASGRRGKDRENNRKETRD